MRLEVPRPVCTPSAPLWVLPLDDLPRLGGQYGAPELTLVTRRTSCSGQWRRR